LLMPMTAVPRTELPSRRAEESDSSAVKTLRKALAILDAFAAAETPLTVAEVAIRAGVTRPTAHRLVQTLIADGYLTQNPRDGRISPGYSVLQLAGSLLDTNQLRVESLPHLEALAHKIGERANLGILHRNQLLYLAGVEKPSLPTIYSRFGKTAPAYCASLGKAILAHLPEDDLRAFLDQVPLVMRTPSTITDKAALRKELAEIKRKGFALDSEEHVPGLFCLSSAILRDGYPVGAIGVTGRSLTPLIDHVATIQHTAEVISHVLSRGG
jgi:DNA-binding IclR family transcriptional regulator